MSAYFMSLGGTLSCGSGDITVKRWPFSGFCAATYMHGFSSFPNIARNTSSLRIGNTLSETTQAKHTIHFMCFGRRIIWMFGPYFDTRSVQQDPNLWRIYLHTQPRSLLSNYWIYESSNKMTKCTRSQIVSLPKIIRQKK